jgi:Tfp pilus assembly protein PilF
LCAYYPLPDHWPIKGVLLAAGLLATISVVVVWRFRREPYLFLGWFWFAGMLVPVIGLVQVGMQSMADRYTYLPSVGIFIAVAWLAVDRAGAWALPRMLLPTGAVLITVACAILTWQQTAYWRDSETLLRHAIAVTGSNWMAHILLGREYATERRPGDAIVELREGLRVEPDLKDFHALLAAQLEATGQTNGAINEYAEAMRLDPLSPEMGNNLGMALDRAGRYAAGIQVFQVALESHPEVEALHLNLGNIYAHSGKAADAAAQFKQALALKPDDVDAHNNLGAMLFQLRQLDAAATEFQIVLKLDPENADARRNLDTILRIKSRAQ